MMRNVRILLLRALMLITLPVSILWTIVRCTWEELVGIPYYAWLDIKRDWKDFKHYWAKIDRMKGSG